MERIAARDARFVKAEFVVQSSLFGQPGASQGFTALMVQPFDAEKTTPPPASPAPNIPAAGTAEAVPKGAAVLVRQDEPTCCAPSPSPESAKFRSEFILTPILSNERDKKHARGAAPAMTDKLNWPDRAATSAWRVVKRVDGQTVTLTCKGGEKKIEIPTSVPVVAVVPASKDDIAPGTFVFVPTERQSDGSLHAGAVLFGKDGVIPPM
jgi:hypothetical protein